MAEKVELQIDVTEPLGLDEPAHIAATVLLPDAERLADRPVVCFAKPGGGYSRHYFTSDLPGPARGAQADFHVERGWIFVALDSLGCGDSSVHGSAAITFATVTRAAQAAEQEILLRLANGILAPGYPPVLQPIKLGIGQSAGGCAAIVQQARFDCYDGVGVLGFSAVHSHPATPPGEVPIVTPWYSRDVPPDQPGAVINAAAIAAASGDDAAEAAWTALAWGFHYDDVPQDVVEEDLAHYEGIVAGVKLPDVSDSASWYSYATPNGTARFTLTPGIVAPEAAAIAVPVLSAMGERDLVVDPLGEARAFRSAPSFDLFVCPRLGHMHNFGGPRALFWERIHRFGEWCAAAKSIGIRR